MGIVVEEYVNKGLSKEKLTEAGKDGIVKAREKYDKSQGFSFNAYAVWWVRQAIIQAIEEKK